MDATKKRNLIIGLGTLFTFAASITAFFMFKNKKNKTAPPPSPPGTDSVPPGGTNLGRNNPPQNTTNPPQNTTNPPQNTTIIDLIPIQGFKYTLGDPSVHSWDDLLRYGVYVFEGTSLHRISSTKEWTDKGFGSAYELIPIKSSSIINGWIEKYGLK